MAKFKATKGKGKQVSNTRRAIPCLIVLIGGMALVSLFFYAMLTSSTAPTK